MAERVVKLPDVGEGIAEAELVEWQVKVGDIVREDAVLGAVMTDKVTVEIPSPAEGRVLWLAGEAGDMLAIGSDFVRLSIDDRSDPATETTNPAPSSASPSVAPSGSAIAPPLQPFATPLRSEGERPLAAPAVRLRAREAGVDLRQLRGTGPPGGSPTTISTSISRAVLQLWRRHRIKRRPRSKTSRSSACAARSPRGCRLRTRAFRTSLISKRSMSPRSRICARSSTTGSNPIDPG
jgi:hypothetical protein